MKLSADLTNKLRGKLGLPSTAGAAEITEAMRAARARLTLPQNATATEVMDALGVANGADTGTDTAADRATDPPGPSAAGRTQAPLTLTGAEAARVRAALELAHDAGAGYVVEAVEAVVADSLDDLGPSTAAAAAAVGAVGAAVPQPSPGHVVLTHDAFRELEERAIHGGKTARDAYLDSVSDRYFPESREAWERQYDLDPEMTRHYLDQADPLVGRSFPDKQTDTTATTFAEVAASDEYKGWKF